MDEKLKFTSILDRKESPWRERAFPAFYSDLNLDQVIERIRLEWGEEVTALYHYFPADGACEDYRREVFRDVKGNGLYGILCGFCGEMKARREAMVQKEAVKSALQKAVWHVREVKLYCDAFRNLAARLWGLPLESGGMQAFREYLEGYLAGEGFLGMQEQAERLTGQMEELRLVLTYESDRIIIVQGEAPGSYDDFLKECFPGHKKRLVSPFGTEPELADLEAELLKAFRKRNPELFLESERFFGEYGNYADAVLVRFASEIGFYLSFYCFEQKMQERGFSFAVPQALESSREEMYARGLYDLALACAGRDVVANDTVFRRDEKFYILTGPNQGGKTTFARSLGQMVYFFKMGLDVPAEAAGIYRFTDICTHFCVEESVETGRGKLREELERLANIMAESGKGDSFLFVVINELFTTAANYDACIMGRRVLEHFLGRECRGIYVTHLRELAQGDPGLVSLGAMLDGQGRRTFRIERSTEEVPAAAGTLVARHGLTYGQLKERLA